MPPLPALHLAALDDLVKQLRFAPAGAARRQLERAEELFSVITPAQAYPEDWIVFAITGYRPELAAPSLVVGEALLGDLGILVERLSVAAELTVADLPGIGDAAPQWLDAAQLCARWNISRKTLDRYRREGARRGSPLPARRVRAHRGRDKLYFHMRHVAAFERTRAEPLRQAASFTRIDAALEQKMVRLARRYRARLGWSLNRTAERLAERYGRGHETVRQLLVRHENAAADDAAPIFSERGPLTDRERRVIARAYARGLSVDIISQRFTRTRPSIYRVLARERADVLRSLVLLDDSSPRIRPAAAALQGASVTTGLGRPAPCTLAQMMAAADADPLPDPRAERDRAGASWILRADAARLVAALPRHNPGAGACDEIETRLRWASRLKAELVRSQLPFLFKSIRAGLGRDVTSLTRANAAALIELCISAIIEGVDQFDPTKGGRLAAPVGLALNRAITRWAKSLPAVDARPTARATAFMDPMLLPVADWTRRVDAWQTALEPDRRVRPVLDHLDERAARFVRARHGWDGAAPPRTVAALAPEFKLTVHHASAFEHECLAAALRTARSRDAAEHRA